MAAPAEASQPCAARITGVALTVTQNAADDSEKCKTAGAETVLTMSGLTVGGSASIYDESGYVLSARTGLRPCGGEQECIFAVRDARDNRTFAVPASENLNFMLSSESERPFRLKSIKIRNPDVATPTQSIMFVGKLASGSTTAYAITVRGNYTELQTFTFPESFGQVVSFSWSPKRTEVTDIRLAH